MVFCTVAPPPVILLPFGEWPADDPGSPEAAGRDLPGLGSSLEPVVPPSDRFFDEAAGLAYKTSLGAKLDSGPTRAPSSLSSREGDVEGSDVPEELKITLREGSVFARAMCEALREIGRA